MKEFNITGRCYINQHYMINTSTKLNEILLLVEKVHYFTINRPRQYGKTTMLYNIAQTLRANKEYFAVTLSFEGLGDSFFLDEKNLASGFIGLLKNACELYENAYWQPFFKDNGQNITTLSALSDFITAFVRYSQRKIVILIDEVDQSSNNELFVHFLAMLRHKYLVRDEIPTFHSVILAGVHDVKNLKLKLRPNEIAKYNSPWNIATDFKVDMNFYPHEIRPMLDEYATDKALDIDSQAVAERIFYYTSGYPFLVSKLCKIFDEDLLPQKTIKSLQIEDIDTAAKLLISENNTNFESLTKNIENNPELYDFIYQIAIENIRMPFVLQDPIIQLGVLYGIFSGQNNSVKIHNRIYNELIINFMSIKVLRTRVVDKAQGLMFQYRNDDKSLNMEAVLRGFQAFMRKEYSKKDDNFLEKNGRLVFLAFIKPIINGSGYDFKEVQISEECRLDVVITYLQHKYIAELKIWYGEKAHQKGLKQLADYLEMQGLTEGYLIVFNKNAKKQWKAEWIEFEDKRIFMIWV